MSLEPNKNYTLPSLEDLFLKTPLYKELQVDIFDGFKVQDVKNFKGTIDAFCIECKKDSIFRRVDINPKEYEDYEDYPRSNPESNVFCISFACIRNESHNMYFYFINTPDSFILRGDRIGLVGH